MTTYSSFTYGDSGQGIYGDSMGKTTRARFDYMMDDILKAVDTIPVDKDGLFTIADYGACDGSTTMSMMTETIKAVRQKHGEVPIQIVYEDQASNDFNSLFRRLHGLIPDPSYFLNDFKKVFVMASGNSFYSQILPDNTADLITSFSAVQYLSKPATKFQNSLHRFPDATEEERQLVEAQAAQDWETFLLLRAKELKSGGMLILSTPSEDPEASLGGHHICKQGFEEGMLKVWRQMRDEGKITQEEFWDSNFYRCFPTLGEQTAPFDAPDSKVKQAGLRLFQARRVLIPCVHQTEWQEKRDTEGVDDRESWAKGVVHENKVWSIHVFSRGLSTSRSQPQRDALVHELYDRLETEIRAHDPRTFRNASLLNFVFIRKI